MSLYHVQVNLVAAGTAAVLVNDDMSPTVQWILIGSTVVLAVVTISLTIYIVYIK